MSDCQVLGDVSFDGNIGGRGDDIDLGSLSGDLHSTLEVAGLPNERDIPPTATMSEHGGS